MPSTAMLLAAGLGTRMRPITNHTPKPLVMVGGKCLIDWPLDQMSDVGISSAVVNVHYLADAMKHHLSGRRRPAVTISDETAQLLDTGGGVAKALPLLGNAPFFVFNCDAVVINGPTPMMERLARAWSDSLDVLMLVHSRATAHGFDGAGDFFVDDAGMMQRRGSAQAAPYVYAGAYVIHPRVLANEPVAPFSMNRIWDRAIAAGRMKALIHDGAWFHVGTPEAIGATDALLARQPLSAP